MLGHTCAWAVRSLKRPAFEALVSFLGVHARLTGSIARHQLEAALRETSRACSRELHLLRRQIVDAQDKNARAHPVLASVKRNYALEPRDEALPAYEDTVDHLLRTFAAMREEIHSTDVAEVVKRHVRDRLAAFPLRAHGGVYFVSAKREHDLFRLKHYLEHQEIGSITHIRVIGNDHEIKLLTQEIHHMITSRTAELKQAIEKTNPEDRRRVARMGTRVKALRDELAAMQELFTFAADVISEKDRAVRAMILSFFEQETVRNAPLFAGEVTARGTYGCASAHDAQVP